MSQRIRRMVRYGLLRIPPRWRARIEICLLRAYEGYLRLRVRGATEPPAGPDGLPVPPARLRVLVSGTADPEFFLETGRSQAAFVRATLARNGVSLAPAAPVLDFGCGCGRLARWWSGPAGRGLYGCDPNRDLVAWCRANLPFMNAAVTEERPPLPYPDASFDFVYALSIFTHLPSAPAAAWMAELARVIRPGGHLLFTTAGDAYRDRLSDPERRDYDDGRAVAQFDTAAGTNLCIVYHPPAYVRDRMIAGFELREAFITPEHPEASAAARLVQDSYLVRRRP
ncbi:MAG TPA: class I SAM-dependent methyltransferase [Solirubrobacteraceae bacterium]|nr:class I SAM-dependent methyltransferase [Solirubrobacteraceae bacterium]